ncbi:MAG: hypothetical protein HY782_15765 [Chloroflexi bacterium]|nr:hypothetical protein [Chloroflexota bacterium]
MSKPTPRWLLVNSILLTLYFFAAPPIYSQTPTLISIPVALAPVQRDTPIELVALTLDADISETGGRTVLSGNSTFKLHNTDTLNDTQVPVGFPAWAGEPPTKRKPCVSILCRTWARARCRGSAMAC